MKKKQKINGFIYFRCIMPIFASAVMLVLIFIPCYRFKTADSGLNKTISLWNVMSTGWDTVREYLFGGGETEKVVSDFSWALLLIIIAVVVLFALGVVFSVYTCIRLMSFISLPDRDSRSNILFITVVPNRIVECVYYAVLLPLFALPMFMPVLYDRFLYYHVELFFDPFDMFWIAAGLYAAIVAVVTVSGFLEKKAGIDIFEKREAAIISEKLSVRTIATDESDVFKQMNDAAKKEQMERILRLLNKDTPDEMPEETKEDK